MNERPTGTAATREFYDRKGWREHDGKAVDTDLFGVKEDGPIRIELHKLHLQRVRTALERVGRPLDLLECGCGGNPALLLLDLCEKYTGTDFSATGLERAQMRLADSSVPHKLQEADACHLPFVDNAFDAVYSAHMVYHIDDLDAQESALGEMLRVMKPGGVLVLITANPRPFLFPLRLARRLLADTPVVGTVLDRLRRKPPLPYRPMTLGRLRRVLSRWGCVEIVTHGLPSTAFNQNVTEFRGLGRIRWKLVRWLDVHHPKLSTALGCFVQVTVTKPSA